MKQIANQCMKRQIDDIFLRGFLNFTIFGEEKYKVDNKTHEVQLCN